MPTIPSPAAEAAPAVETNSTPETTVKKAPVKKTAKKAASSAGKTAAKKTVAKKTAAKKTAKTKGPAKERGPSKTQIAVLKLLHKKPDGLTREELAEKLETFIGGDIMGHVDPKKLKKNSLIGRGLVTLTTGAPRKLKDGSMSESEGAKVYKIIAAGRKLLESL